MYKVVIADDEVLIRMYIREILENNGFEVVGEAEDGLDAITVCKQKHPDFVIMDVNMPVMTGLEAARVIHEDKLAGFVMILTGLPGQGDRGSGGGHGRNGIYCKTGGRGYADTGGEDRPE